MGAKKYNKVLDAFMERLHSNNLIIVERDKFEETDDLKKLQNSLLRQEAITPYQIEKSQLLPYTIGGIKRCTKFNEGELYQDSKGKWQVATSAVKRLREKMHLV